MISSPRRSSVLTSSSSTASSTGAAGLPATIRGAAAAPGGRTRVRAATCPVGAEETNGTTAAGTEAGATATAETGAGEATAATGALDPRTSATFRIGTTGSDTTSGSGAAGDGTKRVPRGVAAGETASADCGS